MLLNPLKSIKACFGPRWSAVARHVIVWRKVWGTRIRRSDWLNLAYTLACHSNLTLRIRSYPRTQSFRSRSLKQSNLRIPCKLCRALTVAVSKIPRMCFLNHSVADRHSTQTTRTRKNELKRTKRARDRAGSRRDRAEWNYNTQKPSSLVRESFSSK